MVHGSVTASWQCCKTSQPSALRKMLWPEIHPHCLNCSLVCKYSTVTTWIVGVFLSFCGYYRCWQVATVVWKQKRWLAMKRAYFSLHFLDISHWQWYLIVTTSVKMLQEVNNRKGNDWKHPFELWWSAQMNLIVGIRAVWIFTVHYNSCGSLAGTKIGFEYFRMMIVLPAMQRSQFSYQWSDPLAFAKFH